MAGRDDTGDTPKVKQIDRRSFMRAASGLVVGVAVGGCGDGGGPSRGTVRVTITGFVGTPVSAGSAQITGPEISPINIVLPALAEGEASVAAGTYQVVYAPPAGYTMAPGETNTREVVVVANEVTEVQFAVVQASGTLRITVTGLVTGATGGGSASVLRTDIGGQTPLAVIVPVGGTVDSSLNPGNYSVTFTAPAGYVIAAGVTNPRAVVITSEAMTTASFAVEEDVTPPAAVIFNSDWSTALGTTSAALQDTGKALPWNIVGGQGLEVISSAGLDFPSSNVLRVTSLAATTGYAFLRRTGMPVPSVGQSRWYRWYMRLTTPDGLEDPETHPIQDGNASSQCNWLFHVYHDSGGAGFWRPQFRPAASVNAYPNDRWNGPNLAKNTTFRFELQIQRTATGTFQMHVRIYNSANTLLHSDGAFNNQESTATLASNPTFNFLNVAALDGLNAGCNGIAGASPPFPFVYAYQGCFAVSGTDWVGPYAGGV